MKILKKIMKIGCLSLCSVLIIFELYILGNANKIAEIPFEIEEDIWVEIDVPQIPLANFIIDENKCAATEIFHMIETDEPEFIEPETETEIEIEVEVEIETETDIKETLDEIEVEEVTTEKSVEVDYQPVELIFKNVPVFMYHTSSENNPGALTELYVKPSEFEKQINYLVENGYTFCTFDDYYNLNNIDKPVFITFDDGYKENYTEIFPILQKYNAKITIFLIINSITDSNLTIDIIKEMNDSGLVKFESHTNTHPSLVAISSNDTRLTDELRNSKIKIEEITGKPVLALAYPNGEFNDTVIEKTKEFYSFGLRKDLGMHNTEYDSFEVRRIRINRSTSLNGFINYIGE